MKTPVPMHWADVVVKRVIAEKGDKARYVCATGITPSGTVHIGNVREIITVELVTRAFKDAGKDVRFIYSWDDYDVFRKVPQNMPQQDMLSGQLRKAIIDVPDPFATESSYARHHEADVEKDISRLGILPEFLYQAKKYRAGEYVEGLKLALQNSKEILSILNAYRTEPLADSWLPISGYCPTCGLDEVNFQDYDGEYGITIVCNLCKHEEVVDLRKAPFLKLPWRVDWPMRWAYEKVDFEPGGKDHSTEGGSFSTGKEIVRLYDWTPPTYQRYDFVRIKGAGGKISSSKGNVITLRTCLEVYEPAIIRWLFAGSRPTSEFAISFDVDVVKIYEDFDKLERIYFGKEKAKARQLGKLKRIYELSCVGAIPSRMPFQPSFRHLTNNVQVYGMDIAKTVEHYAAELQDDTDRERVRLRAECAKHWLEHFAPEDFRFEIQTVVPKGLKVPENMVAVFHKIALSLQEKEWMDKELHNHFYDLVKAANIEPKDFFKVAYNILVNKDKGPQLASFILTIGQEQVAELFSQL